MAAYTLTEARYARVLGWINKLRKEHKIGRPLKRIPRGERSDWRTCPIARALRSTDVMSTRVVLPNGVTVETPNYVAAFIDAFDEGKCTRLRKLAL